MGRFYNGDICGKFWFGVQVSDDISNLVTTVPTLSYNWKVCNCIAEIEDAEYCIQCYETISEHIDAAKEDDIYDDELLYYEEQSLSYNLDKETHYQELLDNMNELKTIITKEVIEEFEKIKQTDDILDAFTGVFDDSLKKLNEIDFNHTDINSIFHDTMKTNIKKKQSILIARYTIGYQLEYCLRTKEYCNIECEY
jgi:hypothetical protein